jgi:serine phosphatase RsbU (regulator of sigma subunit)
MRFFIFILLISVFHNELEAQDTRYMDSLENIIRSKAADSVRIDAMNKLAFRYNYTNPDSARKRARLAFTNAQKVSYRKGMGDASHVIAISHNIQSKYDSAMHYNQKALALRKKINDRRGVSASLNNIGKVYYEQGLLDKAVDFYIQSSKMDEELNDVDGMAASYNNIGLIFWAQNNFEKASEYFNMTLDTYTKMGKKRGMAGSLSNLGGIAYHQKDYEKSIQYFKKSLALYEEENNNQMIALISSNLGEVYAELKRYKDAMPYVKRAIATQNQMGDAAGLVNSQLVLAKLHLNSKNYIAAESSLKNAIQKAESINARKQLHAALNMLSDVQFKTNNYKEAYITFKKFYVLNDTLINLEKSTQVKDVISKYETDKKSKEIELLKKQQQIQELQQQADQSQNRLIRNSLLGLVVIVLVVFFMLYSRYQVKQKANDLLQQKNEDIQKQKEQIEHQAGELAEKNREITDSIHYAKRIQMAILPPAEEVKRLLPDAFILYKPKDIVSGDFYWVDEKNGKTLVAAVDCTGHGVPGALMSVVGSNMLNQISHDLPNPQPDLMLNELNKAISKNLQQKNQDAGIRDGMDLSLCAIDYKKLELQFAAALNSAYIIRKGSITELPADKVYIGSWHDKPNETYRCQTVKLEKGDMLYLFTDGFADQFGGPKGKKFKHRRFIETLVNISSFPCEAQKDELVNTFEEWRGNLEQIDDVCVIGIRI